MFKPTCPSKLSAALALAFASVAMPAYTADAHDHASDGANVLSIVVPYANEGQLAFATKLLDHPYIDQKKMLIHAEVAPEEMEALKAAGMQPAINEAETARIQHFIQSRAQDVKSGSIARALGVAQPSSIANGVHSCYRTVEQIYTTYDQLAAKYPKLVKIKTLGKSWMGEKQAIPAVGNAVPDNSLSSFANILIKYLPASVVARFNLSLFPVDPNPVKAIVVGNFEKQDAQSEPPPNMVWTGGIHAREYAPQEVGMKFIEWLLENYETDANARMMVDTNRYHFIIHNPDGRKVAEQDISARQRKNTNYDSAACTTVNNQGVPNTLNSGVDLNRNYPFGWATGGTGGSDGNSCGETYRGTSAGSEPETKAVLNYIRGNWNQAACKWEGGALPDGRPKSSTYCNPENRDNNGTGELDWKTGASEEYGGGVFIDLHSNARAVLWPWGVERAENDFNTHTPNNKGMAVIAQRLAYHNNYSSQQLLSYNTEGTTKDAAYGYLGAPAYTVEMGRSFYEDCGVFERETYPENFNGFHYLSRVLHRVYKLPFGPDTVNVMMGASSVQAGNKVTVTATVDDNRYRYSNAGQSTIKPPPYPVVYNITGAKAYVDKLPWEAGAVGVDLTLSTSAQAKSDFPDATKTAVGEINTAGLAPGRHMVYVQGTNADGKPGAVSAAFLDVTAAPADADDGDSGGGALGWFDLAAMAAGLAALAGLRRRRTH
ncbi:M14 family zinc carboxypeptidase [uncultured Aquincola sp.]|uniref:M14 family zinc carboxypeptidase n=1 Tax=uncultured Aquincola sp. TaxID=886556 RepID=UPI0032B1FF5F